MIVQEFLNQAIEINNRISRKREQLESLRTVAERCTTSLKAVPGGGHGDRGRLEGIAVRTADLEKEIEADTIELMDAREKIIDVIYTLNDSTERYILQQRYVDDKALIDIANDIGRSYSHTRKLHNDALAAMENDPEIVEMVNR